MHLLKAKKERILQYDIICAVLCFFVVYVHSGFMLNSSLEIDLNIRSLTTIVYLASLAAATLVDLLVVPNP